MIRRRSKIAHLPPAIREQINEFLDSGCEYQRIIDWLSQQGHTGIEMYHLTRWKNSGFMDWLARHEHQAVLEAKLEWIRKLSEHGPRDVQKAAMAVLADRLFDTLNRTDAMDLTDLVQKRPEKLPGLINCFSRFSHEALELEKFGEELAEKQRAAQESKVTDKGGATPETIQRMKQELRLVFRKLRELESKDTGGSMLDAGQEGADLTTESTENTESR